MDDSSALHSIDGPLCSIPHVSTEGVPHPPRIAMAGYNDRLATSLEVCDDSMAPYLKPGDIVVFTRLVGAVDDGSLHVLAGPAGLTVRRLQRLADGRVMAVPTNPACRPEILGEGNEVQVVGVVAATVHLGL